ncbi:MAG: pyruvate kinase [Chloroflexi bacterium]|nr:MAG: pyruvate kinase [Chloroflexota bacterium]
MQGIPLKKTKIICTIGPASQSQVVLEQMIHQGMNIARINFAHGDLDGHRKTIANVRAAAKATNQRIAIFGDLPGPKMRIGKLAKEPIELERGKSFTLQTEEIVGNRERVSLDFPQLPQVVKPGDSIFINDGYIELKVEEVRAHEVLCQVKVGGELRSNKGVNFPGIDLGISAFTKQDHELLKFAAEQQLTAVSQSFVLGAADITAVRQAASKLNYNPFVIAKIERSGALEHLNEIINASDGIMVARGDLGVEIPIEKIPSVQKQIIQKCNLTSKPVITATQMLESMTNNRRPTRAEATDVANAILDGTDCVMLSGETAVGHYPQDTVRVMARIAQQTEANMPEFGIADLLTIKKRQGTISRNDLLSLAVYSTAKMVTPVVIFIPSRSGTTARHLSRFRLPQWIVAPSQHESTCQELQFSYGIYPLYVSEADILTEPCLRRQFAGQWLQEHAKQEDTGTVLLVEGAGTLRAEDTKRIDIIALGTEIK